MMENNFQAKFLKMKFDYFKWFNIIDNLDSFYEYRNGMNMKW